MTQAIQAPIGAGRGRPHLRVPPPADWKSRLLSAVEGGDPPMATCRKLNVHPVTLYAAMRDDPNFWAKYAAAKRSGRLARATRYGDGAGESPLAPGPRQVKFMAELAGGDSLPKVLLRWSITYYTLTVVAKNDQVFKDRLVGALQAGIRSRWDLIA